MTEDDARQLLLVRAIESEDRDEQLLTREDRQRADAAGQAAGSAGSRDTDEDFLAGRARFAAGRLATRHPAIEQIVRHARWPAWIGWAAPLAAFVVGFATNEIGESNRLNLVAFPLLGTLVWNLTVYLIIILHAVMVRDYPREPGAAARLIGRLGALGKRRVDQANPLSRALGQFTIQWARRSAPLTNARAARTLHLAAALFALGLVGGIYLRALGAEYRAGWESTFLDTGSVRAILATVLGPASSVTGVPIPPVERIAAMRWTGPTGGGVNAGPWIHLYTATAFGVVVIPRLLLAAWSAIRARRRAARFAVPGREDFYIRRLLRDAHGAAGSVRVTPYAYRPEAAIRDRLAEILREAMGDAVSVYFDPTVDYGAEESWLSQAVLRRDDDHHILLFSLSVTPEAENHGAFVAGLARRLAEEKAGTMPGAIIDESAFRAHFAGQAGLDKRIATRSEAWAKIVGGAGLVPLAIDLAAAANDKDIRRIEAAMVSGAALGGSAA